MTPHPRPAWFHLLPMPWLGNSSALPVPWGLPAPFTAGCAAWLPQGWENRECFPRGLTREGDFVQTSSSLCPRRCFVRALKERDTFRWGQGPQSLPAQGGDCVLLYVCVVLFLMVTRATLRSCDICSAFYKHTGARGWTPKEQPLVFPCSCTGTPAFPMAPQLQHLL